MTSDEACAVLQAAYPGVRCIPQPWGLVVYNEFVVINMYFVTDGFKAETHGLTFFGALPDEAVRGAIARAKDEYQRRINLLNALGDGRPTVPADSGDKEHT